MSPRLPHPKARQVATPLATPVGGGAADDDALRLVVEAGTVLESSLDHEAALGRIARLAVPDAARTTPVYAPTPLPAPDAPAR